MHISKDKISPHDSANQKEEAETDYTQWPNSMQPQLSVPLIHRFIGGPSGIRKN